MTYPVLYRAKLRHEFPHDHEQLIAEGIKGKTTAKDLYQTSRYLADSMATGKWEYLLLNDEKPENKQPIEKMFRVVKQHLHFRRAGLIDRQGGGPLSKVIKLYRDELLENRELLLSCLDKGNLAPLHFPLLNDRHVELAPILLSENEGLYEDFRTILINRFQMKKLVYLVDRAILKWQPHRQDLDMTDVLLFDKIDRLVSTIDTRLKKEKRICDAFEGTIRDLTENLVDAEPNHAAAASPASVSSASPSQMTDHSAAPSPAPARPFESPAPM
jgi:hypothetical protein